MCFCSDIKDKCDHLYESYFPSYFKRNRTTLIFEKIIKDIKNGSLFGAVKVDINVKVEYIGKFKEFPAFFYHVTFQWRLLEIICWNTALQMI